MAVSGSKEKTWVLPHASLFSYSQAIKLTLDKFSQFSQGLTLSLTQTDFNKVNQQPSVGLHSYSEQ